MKKIYLIFSFISLVFLLVACDNNIKIPDDVNSSLTLSTLYIQLEDDKEIDRDKWRRTSLEIQNSKEELVYSNESLRVRGRGNSTWWSVPEEQAKRPYRLRFDDEVSLLGMKLSKNYVLLAEHFDRSLLRNYFAHRMSVDLNIGYKLETRPVELYVNNEYVGYYTLTEQIETYDKKLNIDTDGPLGGFLIEMEADDRIVDEGIEDINWVRVRDRNYVIKSPDMDDLDEIEAKERTNNIKMFLNLMINNLGTKHMEKYVDVDSFIDYFILNEIAKQIDINWSSVYSYKDSNSKLIMGPIWDFDLGYGNANYGEKDGILFESPEGFWMNGNQWFDIAMSNEDFNTKYTNRFKEVLSLYFDQWILDLDEMYNIISKAGDRNFERWDILDLNMWPITDNALLLNSHKEHYEYLREYLLDRKEWLVNNL